MKHLKSLSHFILSLITLTVVTAFFVSEASSMYVTPPKIIYPKSSLGAPWDRIKFQINVTDAENPISNVTLFYSTNETEPRIYTAAPMELVNGDNFTGTWICEISPQKNGTTIYLS